MTRVVEETAMDGKDQNAPQHQPADTVNIPDAGTPLASSGAEALGPELREIDFPKFDISKLETMSEVERRQHADSMDLPTLGSFVRPALIGIKRLVEAYRPYIQSFMKKSGHQGEQKILTNGKGEPATRDEIVREQLGVGVRRINQLLAKTDPKGPKPTKPSLTTTQEAVVQALVGQGYSHKDAVAMVKAAEGQNFDSLFRSALAQRAGEGGNANPVSDPVVIDPVERREKQEHEAESGDQDDELESVEEEEPEDGGLGNSTRPLPQVEPNEADDEHDEALFARYDPDRDRPEGRPTYTVRLTVTGSKLEATLKKAQEAFGDKLLNVEKVSKISSRADQMGEAIDMISNAKSVCEDLKDQIESWRDNLPDSFRDGDKGSQLEECMEAIEQVITSLDDAESNAESVEFPGMY